MPRKAQLAKIHIAKAAMGQDEDTYRAFLKRVTGKESASALSDKQMVAVLSAYRDAGWDGAKKTGKWRPKSKKPYVRKIFVLWSLLVKAGKVNAKGLKAFVEGQTGVADPEWLTPAQGNNVLEALKAWLDREGVAYER